VNIGSDKVCVEPERLIIHAAEPMDLPIREFCSSSLAGLGPARRTAPTDKSVGYFLSSTGLDVIQPTTARSHYYNSASGRKPRAWADITAPGLANKSDDSLRRKIVAQLLIKHPSRGNWS
jgi:hypothetical protein